VAATYKVLGQSAPVATTNTDLYVAPAPAVVATICVTNTGVADSTFRIAVRPAGAALAAKHYVIYDASIGASQTMALTLGIGVAATDVITVYTAVATVSFSAFGVENP